VRDGRLYHEGLRVGFPDIDPGLVVSSRGSIGADETLDLSVDLPRLGIRSRAEDDKRTDRHQTPNGPGSGLRPRMAEGRGTQPHGGGRRPSRGEFRRGGQAVMAPARSGALPPRHSWNGVTVLTPPVGCYSRYAAALPGLRA